MKPLNKKVPQGANHFSIVREKGLSSFRPPESKLAQISRVIEFLRCAFLDIIVKT